MSRFGLGVAGATVLVADNAMLDRERVDADKCNIGILLQAYLQG